MKETKEEEIALKVFLQISKYVYVEKLGSIRQPTHSPSLLAGCHQPQLKIIEEQTNLQVKKCQKEQGQGRKTVPFILKNNLRTCWFSLSTVHAHMFFA